MTSNKKRNFLSKNALKRNDWEVKKQKDGDCCVCVEVFKVFLPFYLIPHRSYYVNEQIRTEKIMNDEETFTFLCYWLISWWNKNNDDDDDGGRFSFQIPFRNSFDDFNGVNLTKEKERQSKEKWKKICYFFFFFLHFRDFRIDSFHKTICFESLRLLAGWLTGLLTKMSSVAMGNFFSFWKLMMIILLRQTVLALLHLKHYVRT